MFKHIFSFLIFSSALACPSSFLTAEEPRIYVVPEEPVAASEPEPTTVLQRVVPPPMGAGQDANKNPKHEKPPGKHHECVRRNNKRGGERHVPTLCMRGPDDEGVIMEPQRRIRASALGTEFEDEARRGWLGHPEGELEPGTNLWDKLGELEEE